MGKSTKKPKKDKKERRTSIGGQAVLEGVMMRGESSAALAVRDEDGIIRLETNRVKPFKRTQLFSSFADSQGGVFFYTISFRRNGVSYALGGSLRRRRTF